MRQQQQQQQMEHQQKMVEALKPWAAFEFAPNTNTLGRNITAQGIQNFGPQMQGAMAQIGNTLNRNADRLTAGKIAYAPLAIERERTRRFNDMVRALS